MKTQTVLDYFGGSRTEIARAINYTRQAVCLWRETVPPLAQIKLYRLTGGELKPDPSVMALLQPLPRKRKKRKTPAPPTRCAESRLP